jgi:NAD(P)-dependent dehydrogenase (short-subunit alcohol dehydrogenase family)
MVSKSKFSNKLNPLNISPTFSSTLKGKVVVVTGAGSGLGRALAFGASYAGASVGVLDLNSDSVKEVVSKIKKNGSDAFPMVASVTDPNALEKVYSDLIKKFGKIDCLINCAGIAKLGRINELDSKSIFSANEVNITGYFLNAAIVSKKMVELVSSKKISGGSILNVSSASARGASEDSSLYGVAKEAQCMMTRSWAMDLGRHNIRVNTILPGDLFGDEKAGINSAIWNQAYFEKKAVDKKLISKEDPRIGGKILNPEIRALVIEHYVGRTVLRKELSYSDVIEPVLFLLSDSASKITGESIALTGGNPSVFSR